MIPSTTIILDSSVIAKWFFTSEENGEKALKIRDMFLKKAFTLSMPSIIYYEINNLLHTAIKRLRIHESLAKEAYEGFLKLELITYSSKDLLTKTLDKAMLLDISSYDASYVALSELLNVPFITADEKLVAKVKHKNVQSLKTLEI